MFGTLPLTFQLANLNNRFNTSTYKFTVQTGDEGFYYIEVCAGIQAATPAVVGVQGGNPKIGLIWRAGSRSNVDSCCRSAIVSISANDTLSLSLDEGAVYSDSNVQTSFSVFSLKDFLTLEAYNAVFFGTTNSVYSSAYVYVPFTDNVINTGNAYDPTKGEYTCPISSYYFTSVSFAVANLTTYSISQLHFCPKGNKFGYMYVGGYRQTNSTEYNLNSYFIFPYAPRTVSPVFWIAYGSFSFDTTNGQALDPFPFDDVYANIDGLFNIDNSMVTITISGYYYVYIRASPLWLINCVMSLKKITNQRVTTIININRLHVVTHYYASGHGAVVQLMAEDQLKVVGEAGSYFYSNHYRTYTEFFGFLLYSS